jgi:RimJ/RimL family protein N-acetyltransferase
MSSEGEDLPPVVWDLTTERLRLRRMTAADADFYCQLLNDPDYIEQIADRGVRTPAEALENLQSGQFESYREHGFGLYVVERLADRVPLGMAGLVSRSFLPEVDIGYGFLPIGRGQGYAQEAARAVVTHAKDELGLHRLAAITSPGNEASIRLLLHLGFESAGTIVHPETDDICRYFELGLLAG